MSTTRKRKKLDVPEVEAPYKIVDHRDVVSFPPKPKLVQIPVFEMKLENIQFSSIVFDNLRSVRKADDLPFYMGRLEEGSLPNIDYKTVAEKFKDSKKIGCHSNMNYYNAMKKGKRTPDKFIVPTGEIKCDKHSIDSEYEVRHCSHYFMSEINGGDELAVLEELGLSKLLKVAGLLPSLNPEFMCISSVGVLVSERDHLLGYHRENNLYCSVNLLLFGKKKWTIIERLSNKNFQATTRRLAKNNPYLETKIQNCSDPSQHKVFATFFAEDRTFEVRHEIIQNPGEIFFIPSNLYHQVEVLENSVAIAFNTVDAEWTQLEDTAFHPHCSDHDSLSAFNVVPTQRAAYASMVKYAKEVSQNFLSRPELHPDPELINAFLDKMRLLAIEDYLDQEEEKTRNDEEPESVDMDIDNVENDNTAQMDLPISETETLDTAKTVTVENDKDGPETSIPSTAKAIDSAEKDGVTVEIDQPRHEESIPSTANENGSAEKDGVTGNLYTATDETSLVVPVVDVQSNSVSNVATSDAAGSGNEAGAVQSIYWLIPGNVQAIDVTNNSGQLIPMYDKNVGACKGKVLVQMDAVHQCLHCSQFFISKMDAKFHCDKTELTCSFCHRILNNPTNQKSHEKSCNKNPAVIEKNAKEEKQKKPKFNREKEILKNLQVEVLPSDQDLVGKKALNCEFCAKACKYGINGSGLRRHQDFCKKNPNRKRQAKKGSVKQQGKGRRRNIPPMTMEEKEKEEAEWEEIETEEEQSDQGQTQQDENETTEGNSVNSTDHEREQEIPSDDGIADKDRNDVDDNSGQAEATETDELVNQAQHENLELMEVSVVNEFDNSGSGDIVLDVTVTLDAEKNNDIEPGNLDTSNVDCSQAEAVETDIRDDNESAETETEETSEVDPGNALSEDSGFN